MSNKIIRFDYVEEKINDFLKANPQLKVEKIVPLHDNRQDIKILIEFKETKKKDNRCSVRFRNLNNYYDFYESNQSRILWWHALSTRQLMHFMFLLDDRQEKDRDDDVVSIETKPKKSSGKKSKSGKGGKSTKPEDEDKGDKPAKPEDDVEKEKSVNSEDESKGDKGKADDLPAGQNSEKSKDDAGGKSSGKTEDLP